MEKFISDCEERLKLIEEQLIGVNGIEKKLRGEVVVNPEFDCDNMVIPEITDLPLTLNDVLALHKEIKDSKIRTEVDKDSEKASLKNLERNIDKKVRKDKNINDSLVKKLRPKEYLFSKRGFSSFLNGETNLVVEDVNRLLHSMPFNSKGIECLTNNYYESNSLNLSNEEIFFQGKPDVEENCIENKTKLDSLESRLEIFKSESIFYRDLKSLIESTTCFTENRVNQKKHRKFKLYI